MPVFQQTTFPLILTKVRDPVTALISRDIFLSLATFPIVSIAETAGLHCGSDVMRCLSVSQATLPSV